MKTVFLEYSLPELCIWQSLGAINNWAKISKEESNNYFCIVDLHSLTSLPKSNELNSSIVSTSKACFLLGLI